MFVIFLYLLWYGDYILCSIFEFQVPTGTEAYAQYGQGPAAWGAYNIQQAQGRR